MGTFGIEISSTFHKFFFCPCTFESFDLHFDAFGLTEVLFSNFTSVVLTVCADGLSPGEP